MAQPTQLTPTEQDALVKQIGLAMLRVAPEDWEQLTVDYRAVGRYAESTGQVTFTDGSAEPWEMPADLRGLFARLRAGMYREGRGTWFNARYRLDHPSSYNLEYDREEPVWDAPPPPQAYPDDMRMFPRTDENVPEWLRRRLASAPPLPPGPGPGGPSAGPPTPRFRVARIFDGPGEDGRPSVNRPPVDEMDIPELLDYLDGAPLVGPARGYDVDLLDPNGQKSVPVAFHTDGTWIWPAAVNYYLREHDISPETDLIEHIRRMRFKLVPVDEQTRSAAQLFLGPPPPGPGPRPGPPAPAPTRAMPVPAPPPVPSPVPVPSSAPPRAALPSQGPPAQQIDQLRARLDDLDVPETAYRIGPPAGRGWVMEQTDEGWRVGWHDRDWVAPAMFEDVADASAFLLGKLLLDTDRWAAGPKNPELPPASPSDDHGFEPMSAPIEAFDGGPEFGRPAGPVKPPPGTPGYTDSPGRGFGPPPGTPPRPAPTMAMEPPSVDGLDTSARGMDAPAHGFDTPDRGFDSGGGFGAPGHGSPAHGLETPGQGFDSGRGDSPSHGLDSADRGFEPPGRGGSHGLDTPGRGFDPAGRGFDSDHGGSPNHGLDPAGRGGDPGGRGFGSDHGDSPSHGLDPADRGFEPPGRAGSPGHGLDTPGRGFAPPGRGDDSAGRGLDTPGRGFDSSGRGFDQNGRADGSPAHGFDSGRGEDSPGRGFDPGRGDASGLESAGRGGDSAGRGLDSANHGFDSPRRGLDSGRGLDSANHGADTPGRGLDPANHGFDSTGHGFDSAGRGLDPAGRGTDTPGHGLDSTNHGFDSAGRGADAPGRGLDPAGHGLDSGHGPDSGRGLDPGRGFDPANHGFDSAGHGADAPGRGHDPAGRGLDPSRDSSGRGLDSPPRGVELPARGGDQATVLAARPTNGSAAAPPGSEWPIVPLPGEPPLTLFRGKRVIELEPGVEIDRFGDDDGNLVYAAGTPFAERSLVPEWIDRPYHVYRVRHPMQALTGAAIPWFDQPGGGTAFLLPDSINDMVAQGALVEINDRERPPA